MEEKFRQLISKMFPDKLDRSLREAQQWNFNNYKNSICNLTELERLVGIQTNKLTDIQHKKFEDLYNTESKYIILFSEMKICRNIHSFLDAAFVIRQERFFAGRNKKKN